MKLATVLLALLLIFRHAHSSVTMPDNSHSSTQRSLDGGLDAFDVDEKEEAADSGHGDSNDHPADHDGQDEEPHDDEDDEPHEEEPHEEEPEEEEEEPQEEEPEEMDEVPDELTISDNDEDELERNYRKIADDLKEYQEAYKLCIDNIKDIHFDQKTVDECVGENYNLLIDDINYIKRKIIAQSERALREKFVTHCYHGSDGNIEISEGCDLMEQDTVKMVRHEIDFALLLNVNRLKYEAMYAKLDSEFFDRVVTAIKPVFEEMDKLLEELYDHRLLAIASVKQYIDERTEKVRAKYAAGEVNTKPKLKKTKMVITSQLRQPEHYYINLDRLPRPVILNGKPKMYGVDTNPYVEKWLNNVGPQRFSEVNTPNEQLKNWQPKLDVGYGQDDFRQREKKGV